MSTRKENAIAEETLMLILGSLRNMKDSDHAVRYGSQKDYRSAIENAGGMDTLEDCTVGLVGLDSTAMRLAELLQGFHAEVWYFDEYRVNSQIEDQLSLQYVSIKMLIQKCKVVNVRWNPNQFGKDKFDYSFFKSMCQGSYYINLFSGDQTDIDALCTAISEKHLKGAGGNFPLPKLTSNEWATTLNNGTSRDFYKIPSDMEGDVLQKILFCNKPE